MLDGDQYANEGGSALTVAGTLTNSGQVYVGPLSGLLNTTDTLSVGALAGTGSVLLAGSTAQATFAVAAAAPTALGFSQSLYSTALMQYGSGQIGTIASGGKLFLDGPDAIVADAGHTGTDSALTGLSRIDGTLVLLNAPASRSPATLPTPGTSTSTATPTQARAAGAWRSPAP